MPRAALVLLVLAAAAPRALADDPPAYQLELDKDIPALAITSLTTIAWFVDLGPAWCAPRCDPATVDAFDRPFAGRYLPGWSTAGTLAAAGVLAAPVPVLLALESPGHAVSDAVVVAESVMFASSVAVVFETGVRRPRPFLYGDRAPLAVRDETNASLSFFSGHTADSFAATIALWRTLDRLRVRPRWKYLALGLGLAGSSFVGMARVVSGDHFPTDVIVGAGVGASFGFLLPALHGHGVTVTPIATDAGWTLSVAGAF